MRSHGSGSIRAEMLHAFPAIQVIQLVGITPPGSAPRGNPWTSVLSAVAATVSAFVLALGATVAQRYLTRATASVDAAVFATPAGLALHVQPCIQSFGLTRLKLDRSDATAPMVSVVEHQVRASGLVVGDPASQGAFETDSVVDPGETLTDSLVFRLDSLSWVTLGWRVQFTFASERRWQVDAAKKYWFWTATTFVPAPRPVGFPDVAGKLVTEVRQIPRDQQIWLSSSRPKNNGTGTWPRNTRNLRSSPRRRLAGTSPLRAKAVPHFPKGETRLARAFRQPAVTSTARLFPVVGQPVVYADLKAWQCAR